MARPGRPSKEPRDLGVPDLISLGYLAAFCPPALVDAVLQETGRYEQRTRLLPSRVVVYYVLAMALFSAEGYRELFRLLVEGLRAVDPSLPITIPQKSSFSKARERVGSEPLRHLFEAMAEPLASSAMPGAFYREWRLMSIDGSTMDVPDTAANEAHFGRPAVSRGERSAFPKLRWVALGEVGSRAVVGLQAGPYHSAEIELTRPLIPLLKPGMLCLCRLVTTVLDPARAPAAEIAALYAERWEVEISIKEVKSTQGRPHAVLRSKKPDGVVQELYGFLIVHYALRRLLCHASAAEGTDPDRLSFITAQRAVRRKLSRPESFSPQWTGRDDG
ncbi:hypothetical protein BH23GEM3_BH23GEM3_08690 [soil metagenome]